MTLKVRMYPGLDAFHGEQSGIRRVVEAYVKYLPLFGVEYVDKNAETYDLTVSHASARPGAEVVHTHGLYWTADYTAPRWEHRANSDVIASVRAAKEVTVPSAWVGETFQRDMRFSPTVIGHGIEWQEWQGNVENSGYVLWNKNRIGDVCDPTPMWLLARSFPKIGFVTTFKPNEHDDLANLKVIGLQPHDMMKQLVMGAGVYLSTTKETFGIGVLEAMAAGVPVLGFDYGGNRELVQHGVNGYLAEPGNLQDLRDGLIYCVEHRKVLGENSKELAKRWTWEAACEKVAGVYQLATREEPPTVSIIIPSYNYGTEEQLGRAVRSACRQTDNRVSEVIVVDDGSDDNGATEKLVSDLTQDDRRVRYIRQPNRGVAEARNTGIRASTGKYVLCLDADDTIDPEFVRFCVDALEQDRSLGIAFTGLFYVKPDGDEGVSPWPDGFNYDAMLERRNQIPTCCVFRRKIWERLGGYKKRYTPIGAGSEDAEFWLRVGAYGWNARQVTRQPLFIYSWLSGRVSGNKDYNEPDWHAFHPWTKDGLHPFASMASPKNGFSHLVMQYDQPVVSVIIPVGKGHEESVRDSLDSLEAQTFRRWEAIVIWDSDDQSQLEELRTAYPYMRLTVLEKRSGAGVARNIGARQARAKLLLFLDADDWLYPAAMEKLYAVWSSEGSIAYSDYVGKAFMSRADAITLKDRLLYYDDRHGEAVIRHESHTYDCIKAVHQPDREMYIWNLITSLVPKAWHDEIGGFDENMSSWEDWDYWIRMARAGKCFTRIPEPLVVYRFYTGSRRETGLRDSKNLVEYLRQKTEGTTPMPCNCKGNTMTPVAAAQTQERTVQTMATVQDDDLVLALYTNQNRGQHRVFGGATGRYYGYRGGGQTFYVHKRDIEVQPQLFQAVARQPEQEQPLRESPPEPAPLSKSNGTSHAVPDDEPEPTPVVDETELVVDDIFDVRLIPGVSDFVAEYLITNDLTTPDAIIDFGMSGLTQIKGVGPARADAILAYLRQYVKENDR